MNEIDTIGDFNLADEVTPGMQEVIEATMTTAQSMTELAIRFFLNLLVCWIIIQFFYYRKSRRRDYYFTFMVFSSAMLLLLYMMGNVEVGVGLTLGLFAIFGVIRYRTETVPIREMTYLFAIIAISAVNGLAPVYRVVGVVTPNPHFELALGSLGVTMMTNVLMIILIGVLEAEKILHHVSSKLVLYDNIELIVPERHAELKADLEKRLGFAIENLEVGHVDFLKDAAFIKVYYHLDRGQTNTIGQLTRAKDYVE